MASQIISIKPHTTDLRPDCIYRYEAAERLGVTPRTLYRWDSELATLCRDYRSIRCCSRTPITPYQLWCLRKIKDLYRRDGAVRLTRQQVANIIKSNQNHFTLETFNNERSNLC